MRRVWRGLLLSALLAGVASSVRADGFVVVAHPGVEGSTISRETLAAIYLKKVVQWGDHTSIRPVDQSGKSLVRHAFSAQVLGRSLSEIQRFWWDRLAVDRVSPPTIKSTDEEVLAFVARTQGAIGYVSAAADVPPDVKVVRLKD